MESRSTFTVSGATGSDVISVTRPFSFAINALKNRFLAVGRVFNKLPCSIDTPWSVRGTRIGLLLLNRTPLTILLKVSSFVIKSIKGKSFRFIPHIGPEVQKVLSPFLAYSYSPSSVNGKVKIVRVRTSLNHFLPNSVGFAVGLSVTEIKRSIMAILTFGRSTLSKMRSFDDLKLFAVPTLANPLGLSLFGVWSALHNSPITKHFSCHIFQWFHMSNAPCGTIMSKYNRRAI